MPEKAIMAKLNTRYGVKGDDSESDSDEEEKPMEERDVDMASD